MHKYKIHTVPVQELTHVDKYTPCFLDKIHNKIYVIDVPDSKLTGVPSIHIQGARDIEKIPKIQGIYWIATNEPIAHCLNRGVNLPNNLNEHFRIIYSGSSCDMRNRAKQHLLRTHGAYGTMSGISVDILQSAPTNKSSHTKCLWSPANNKKIPKLLKSKKYVRPLIKEDIIRNMHLLPEEQYYISKTDEIFFKNGINVQDEKHLPYQWIFYYLPVSSHSIRDFVEIEWRKLYGIPILCSYNEGR